MALQRKKTKKKSEEKEEIVEDEKRVFASCSFDELGLHPSLSQHLKEKMGFEVPTVIQAQAIPVVLSGKDVLVNAGTGTGKTIVYLAPIVHLLQMRCPRVQRSDGTFAMILVPTRELCMQVYEILQKLLQRFVWIVPGYLTGGENRSKEKARLRKGISILVATPGRLLDHMKNTSSFSYINLHWIVFDEADSILELGFGKAIEEILEFLRVKGDSSNMKVGTQEKLAQQKLLLSATLNEKVNRLAHISLDDPVMVGLQDEKIKTKVKFSQRTSLLADSSQHDVENYRLPDGLAQRYVKVPCGSRLSVLLSLIRSFYDEDSSHKMVVFFSTCDGVDFHHAVINSFLWSTQPDLQPGKRRPFIRCKTFCLHGNMDHDARRAAFQGFRTEKSGILLCTDVAARGLDFPKLKRIIQYDSPGEATEYVHRVGRTARLGEKGEALLFLQPIEADYLHDLQSHNVSLTELPLKKMLDKFAFDFLKSHGRGTNAALSLDTHPWVLSLQKAIENFVSGEVKIALLAKNAFCSWVRAYAAHKGELKRIFMVKKLHLGHVARSFGLREQPSLVGRSSQLQAKKRKWDLKRKGTSLKRQRVLRT